MEDERTGAAGPGRLLGRVAVGVLAAAVLAGTVAVAGRAVDSAASGAAAPSSAAPTRTPTPVPVTEPPTAREVSDICGPLPEVGGVPVGQAQPALEAVGAEVTVIDARGWSRPVQPDWVVCTDGQTSWGDGTPTDDVTLAAVPAGDPCP